MASTESTRTARIRRAARMARIIDRLERLDDGTLEELDRLTRQAVSGSVMVPGETSRRRFLRAAVAGGTIMAVTGGLVVWQMGYGHLSAEVGRLREVIGLYEAMEEAGLDERLEEALGMLDGLIGRLGEGAEALRSGLEAGRTALLDFQARFPSLQSAFQWLQQTLAALSQRMLALENSVNGLLEITGPLTETMGSFLRWILDHLPGPAASQVQDGLERLGEVVTMLPDLVEGLHQRILEPMDGWFGSRASTSLGATLVQPLLVHVFDPAESLLDRVAQLASAWEETRDALRQILERRKAIRSQIQGAWEGPD
ncbi:MAG TPA: hypothetical protein EYH27_03655 [Anaerolineales bacterium]|nr:hypothetical protein [Anaerolineae bacterium]HIP87516.1 hypothetical protein [Anaerolineales bacterium]